MRAEASSEVEFGLEVDLSFVTGEGLPSFAKLKKVGPKKRKLSPSMILTGKQERKSATRSGGGEKDGIHGTNTCQ